MTKEDRKNAYLYCKFRDAQFYARDGMTQRELCKRTLPSRQTVSLIVKNLLLVCEISGDGYK